MQRLFVGDVQGCADELDELVGRAEKAFGTEFELWLVGDLVNRGPDNRRVLERVRSLVEAGQAQYVLGNHDIHLVSSGLGLREVSPDDSIGDVLAAPDAMEWVDWLRARPLVLQGQVGDQAFGMVHAASAPEWSLAKLLETGRRVSQRLSGSRDAARTFLEADPAKEPLRDALGLLTRCRSVAPDGRWSSEEPDAAQAQADLASGRRAWHRVWAEHDHPHGLVYGHWAWQGLHVAKGLRGLDTGCVHHGRGRDGFLTAWLPDDPAGRPAGVRPFDAPDDRFWQIPARRRYYHPAADG